MNIGFLILHYNTPELTADLCRMVTGAIVIDNGSSVGKRYKGPNECIRQDNLGFTRGWNAAIKRLWSRFDAFWLFNSDVIIDSASISRIVGLMETGLYDILTPSFNCWMKQCQNHGTGTIREIKCLELTAPVITRTAFEKIGMFDGRFSLGSGVDFDFCFRAAAAGIRIWCDDGSSFNHLQHKTITSVTRLKDYSQAANREMNTGMAYKYGAKWREKVKNKLNINNKTDMSKKTVAVYTTIFGRYDSLKAVPKQIVQADYFCITDESEWVKSTMEDATPPGETWNIIQVAHPRTDMHPRMRAKWFKMFPWDLSELRDYDVVIFQDGDVQVTSAEWVGHCIRSLKGDLLQFRHPFRDCIYTELEASAKMAKYRDQDMNSQIAFYRTFHPEKWGLYACTVMVRRKSARINSLMMSWWYENCKFTWQDQLSFPVVCRVHNILPETFAEDLYRNKFFKVVAHADKKDQELISVADPAKDMTRNDVMNEIIRRMKYEYYLEIGLRDGYTFNAIEIALRESVDPVKKYHPTHEMTSDDFFKMLDNDDPDRRYDMIFVDGDHEYGQVLRDVANALRYIREAGCVVCHDTNPPDKRYTENDRCYTAYMILPYLAGSNMPFEVYTLTIPKDEGNGITVIFKGKKKTVKLPEKGEKAIEKYQVYENFDANRKMIANLVTYEELMAVIEKKAQ